MKKGIFLLVALLTLGTTVQAKEIAPTNKIGVNYTYSEAVSFVERNIKFHVFLNGDFDFDTHFRNNNRVRIERNYRGQVSRIGNTFINYDVRGNVKRIGSVYIDYSFGNLARVGNLEVRYDRWGNPRFYGHVKNYNTYYNSGNGISIHIGGIYDYYDNYFYRNDFRRDYTRFREDNNFFYYRANTNAKIGKRSKIIKRRKPSATHNRTRGNTTYNKKVNKRSTVKKAPVKVAPKRKAVKKVTPRKVAPRKATVKKVTPKRTTSTRTTTKKVTPKRAISTRTTQKKATPTKSTTKRKVAKRTTRR